jgi:hypothetical protein
MAISIDWGSRVITVPQSFLTLISGTSYSLDTNAFHIALKDLEDDEAGIAFPPTHNHNTTVLLGGIEYARVIEFINGYTITFEEGVYSVSLVGSNNNILDVVNLNQVSIRANNSAGLINVFEIQLAAFDNVVTIDTTSSYAGTLYPSGTRAHPVNNLASALTIAEGRGFNVLHIKSSMTIASGDVIDDYVLTSDDWAVEITLDVGSSCVNTEFRKLSIYGELSGVWNVFVDCWLYTVTNFKGWMIKGSFEDIRLSPYVTGEQSFFDDIVPLYPAVDSILRLNTNANVACTKMNGYFLLEDETAGSVVTFGMESGILRLATTCGGGEVVLSGSGVLVDASMGTVVDVDGFMNTGNIADGVRVELATELARIDAAITTRTTPGDIFAAV